MTMTFHRFIQSLLKIALTIFLIISIAVLPLVTTVEAARTSMSGDFPKDTVSVARSLKATIAITDDDQSRSDAQKEAVVLITDYISRYRNRPQVNKTVSYTTMQTALNAMAGHIKTFSNRPIPDELKSRLNKELSKAEEIVLRED